MGWLELGLIITAAVIVWLFRAWFMPNCRRCKGRKVNAVTRWWGGERFGPCGKCGGSGSRQVLGSKTVHRAVQSIITRRSKEN